MRHYDSPGHGVTSFGHCPENAWLARLTGLTCGSEGRDEGPLRARGMMGLFTDAGLITADMFALAGATFADDAVRLAWHAAQTGLDHVSQWRFSARTGVWVRRDTLTNASAEAMRIFRCMARFTFSPRAYEIYSQSSRWCNENQGQWRPLSHGGISLASEGGRTCQGATPYLCLREVGRPTGAAFHLLPRGDWKVRITSHTALDSVPYVVLEMGWSDDSLDLALPPGGSIDLPEIWIQSLPRGEPERAAPHLHRHLLDHHLPATRDEAPVAYNTWFDEHDDLDPERMRGQLAAAQGIGCEVFVVDAGWFGPSPGPWVAQRGDWREQRETAFRGQMRQFADAVRAAGLGFGLWIEPEAAVETSPVVGQHPHWFHRSHSGHFIPDLDQCYPNLEDPQAFDWVLSEMCRLVDTYELAWMKVDFNHEIGPDPSGAALRGYYDAWYRLLDQLRSRYPEVYFEGCAGGGMRSDISTLSHFDGHFLSDTIDPVDTLRIYQGALLRLPPGLIAKWTALRSVRGLTGSHRRPPDDGAARLVAPGGAGWQTFSGTDVDFASAVCLPGVFGLSGDIAGLPAAERHRLAEHVGFFKRFRGFIARASADLLTPVCPKEDRGGWAALEFRNPDSRDVLLFVYRLDDGAPRKCFRLRALDARLTYTVTHHCPADGEARSASGRDLMSMGLEVELADRNRAAVLIVSPG